MAKITIEVSQENDEISTSLDKGNIGSDDTVLGLIIYGAIDSIAAMVMDSIGDVSEDVARQTAVKALINTLPSVLEEMDQ